MIEYTFGQLKSLIKESSQESKPKIGDGVEKENKKNNEAAYKEIKKKVKDYDGGLTEKESKKLPPKTDPNNTTIDYDFDTDPGKEYKDRVKAQVLGYTSKLEQENGIEKGNDYEGNKKIYDQLKDAHEKKAELKLNKKKSGLTAREMPDKMFDKDSMFENKKTMQRLYFKKTKFVTESHMKSRIPDNFKVEGKKFIMKDNVDNEYLVEWKDGEANVISHENKTKLNETMERIKSLFDYTPSDHYGPTSGKNRLNEDTAFRDVLAIAKEKTQKK